MTDPNNLEDRGLGYGEPFGIGKAVRLMRDGEAVTRRGWNGKGMYIALQRPGRTGQMSLPFVYMKTAQGDLVPWLCSQTDLLAEDYEVYPHARI